MERGGGGGVGGGGVVFRCAPYLEGSATWFFKKVVETRVFVLRCSNYYVQMLSFVFLT